MMIKKKSDGTLIVPIRAESNGAIGDGVKEVKPSDKDYQKWLKEYNREQQILNANN